MKHILKLNLGKRSYNIIIGTRITRLLGRYIKELDLGTHAYIITNAYLRRKYGRLLTDSLEGRGLSLRLKLVPDSEKSKSPKVAFALLEDLARYDHKKRLFIIAFGGGVIGDLAGFIAAIYKRGIPYVQVPTTLLAQVDSAIGGKTAVDLRQGKNLIGAFYQPRLVFSDTALLGTLGKGQLRNGLAEVIKYAVIKDAGLFRYLEGRYRDVLDAKAPALEFIIQRCSRIKAKIVQQDEKEEKGIRTTLNFGHTLGHALEAASGFRAYHHGEAIALGMLVASDISKKLGLLNHGTCGRLECLIRRVGLPTRIKKIALDAIIKAYYHDKKFIGSKNRLVLATGIGTVKIVEDVPLDVIKDALSKRL